MTDCEEIQGDDGEKPEGYVGSPFNNRPDPSKCNFNPGEFCFEHDFDSLEVRWSHGTPYLACANCNLAYTRLAEQVIVIFAALKRKFPPEEPSLLVVPEIFP